MSTRERYKEAARMCRIAERDMLCFPELYVPAMRELYILTRGKPLVRPLEGGSIGMFEYRAFLFGAKLVERYYLCGPTAGGRRFLRVS